MKYIEIESLKRQIKEKSRKDLEDFAIAREIRLKGEIRDNWILFIVLIILLCFLFLNYMMVSTNIEKIGIQHCNSLNQKYLYPDISFWKHITIVCSNSTLSDVNIRR